MKNLRVCFIFGNKEAVRIAQGYICVCPIWHIINRNYSKNKGIKIHKDRRNK